MDKLKKKYIVSGLVSLGSINDGGFNISHTISNMLVFGGHAEPRHRVRLQKMMTLPRMHQGESAYRFRKKVRSSRESLKLASKKREEALANTWKISDNVVRNRWVNLARKALDQQRGKRGKSVVWVSLCFLSTGGKYNEGEEY